MDVLRGCSATAANNRHSNFNQLFAFFSHESYMVHGVIRLIRVNEFMQSSEATKYEYVFDFAYKF